MHSGAYHFSGHLPAVSAYKMGGEGGRDRGGKEAGRESKRRKNKGRKEGERKKRRKNKGRREEEKDHYRKTLKHTHTPITYPIVFIASSNCSGHSKVTDLHIVLVDHQDIPCRQVTVYKPLLLQVFHPLQRAKVNCQREK